MGMNEDSYVGKIQRKRRVFFRERKFSEKGKKDLPEEMDGGLEEGVRELRREERVKKKASFSGR